MLTITVAMDELWNEKSEEFTSSHNVQLDLEHSLASLSKWEYIFEKPFLGDGEKSDEEVVEYVKCMTVTKDFPPEVFSKLSQQNYDAINEMINAKATATWFVDELPARRNSEVITSELIYYWMVAFQIPFECQYWHLNRLFALIKVCDAKNQKPKKMTRAEMISQRNRLNAQRKAERGSTG